MIIQNQIKNLIRHHKIVFRNRYFKKLCCSIKVNKIKFPKPTYNIPEANVIQTEPFGYNFAMKYYEKYNGEKNGISF